MATTNDLPAAAAFLAAHFPQGGRVLCAVSGGLDSMCLLHYLCAREGFSVAAAHFNHLLRGARSDADQLFVEDWCLSHRIPLWTGEGDTRRRAAGTGESLEEAARNLRYAFLLQTAEENGFDAVLTAHHAQDNAETVLLNLLRGTGTAGLGGIPAMNGRVYRPFLQVPKEDLTAYAAKYGLPHVEDESNETDDAARNVLRHRVLPVLKELNPRAAANISRAAAITAQDSAVLDEMASAAAAKAAETADPRALLAVPETVGRRAALQMLGKAAGGRKDLTARHAEMLLALCRRGRGEAHFPKGVHACIGPDGRLRLWKQADAPEERSIEAGGSVRFGGWEVTLTEERRGGAVCLPQGAALTVTAWRSGDRMRLTSGRGSRSVKRLCAERGISPAERDGLPVLRAGGAPVAMARLGISLDFAPQGEKKAVYVIFKQITEGENV